MGNILKNYKQKKIEGNYLPETPQGANTLSRIPVEEMDMFDPRSPNNARTPLQLPQSNAANNQQDVEMQPQQGTPVNAAAAATNPITALRKRFFKTFQGNIDDPRSPNPTIDRTPLIWREDLNMDDTFADLDAGSKTGNYAAADLVQMPMQVDVDPRSPTIGVQRTPIVLNAESEPAADELFNNFAETLHITKSSTPTTITAETEQVETTDTFAKKPTNKHLDNVRIGRKRTATNPVSRTPRKRNISDATKNDNENLMIYNSTPVKSGEQSSNNRPRRPFSCVQNISRARSHSAEAKPQKSSDSILSLSSFDDILNPIDNPKVADLRIMQGSDL